MSYICTECRLRLLLHDKTIFILLLLWGPLGCTERPLAMPVVRIGRIFHISHAADSLESLWLSPFFCIFYCFTELTETSRLWISKARMTSRSIRKAYSPCCSLLMNCRRVQNTLYTTWRCVLEMENRTVRRQSINWCAAAGPKIAPTGRNSFTSSSLSTDSYGRPSCSVNLPNRG